jgi:hypothetical protein
MINTITIFRRLILSYRRQNCGLSLITPKYFKQFLTTRLFSILAIDRTSLWLIFLNSNIKKYINNKIIRFLAPVNLISYYLLVGWKRSLSEISSPFVLVLSTSCKFMCTIKNIYIIYTHVSLVVSGTNKRIALLSFFHSCRKR